MRNYVIINGVNSLTKNGLAIRDLPPITKTMMRTLREEIDGRDGDIITELGYSAYDKSMTIGLFGTGYDIDDIIAFFNQSGTIVFSNEPDKFYNFKIIDQIDYNKLLKFKEATIRFHCQPFKYPLNETPLVEEYEYVEATGTNVTIDNTAEAIFNKIDLLGNTSQNGTPTPSSPIPINVVSGDNTIDICGKNLLDIPDGTNTSGDLTITRSNGKITFVGTATSTYPNTGGFSFTLKPGTYTISSTNNDYDFYLWFRNSNNDLVNSANLLKGTKTITVTSNNITTLFIGVENLTTGTSYNIETSIQIEKGSTATTYEPYIGNSYPIYLGVENLINPSLFTISGSYNVSSISNGEVVGTSITGYAGVRVALGQNVSLKTNDVIYVRMKIKGNVAQDTFNTIQLFNSSNTGITSTETKISTPSLTTEYQEYIMKFVLGTDDTLNKLFIQHKGNSSDVFTIKDIQVSYINGSYTPYGTTPIELCKIGTYQDYIYKDNGSWYLHKEILKVKLTSSMTWYKSGTTAIDKYYTRLNYDFDSSIVRSGSLCNRYKYANNGTNVGEFDYSQNNTVFALFFCYAAYNTSTINSFKADLDTNEVICYVPMPTPTNTEITDTTLIEQLEALKLANSYEGQTNISQTNNDLPFILDLSALKEGSDHLVINNNGNIYAKPTMDIEGTGVVDIYLNDVQILEADLTEINNIVIDTEAMEAYNPETGALANRLVTGEYDVFKLESGENDLRFSGNLTKATITNYERWL